MIESLGPFGIFLTAVAGFLAAVGVKELVMRAVTRRGERADAAEVDRRQVTAVSAEGNLEVLRVLLQETKDRVDGYERSIADMKAAHAADIRELKTENRQLTAQVDDLRRTLQDYQLGNRVPRGYVLVPLIEIKRIREAHAGLLSQRWYPGEHELVEGAEGPSIHARITRLEHPGMG